MFGSSILEAAIAVLFVYLLLSLMCTALNEGIASLVQKRGKNLFEGIKNLLNDPTFTGLAQQVYNHGLIGGISQHAAEPGKKTRLPSYVSSENFSLALLDILGTRGIISAEYGDLLANAESADDAYEEALRAAKATPGDPQLAAAVESAKAAQERTVAALQAIADKAKAAQDQAAQAASANPGDAELSRARWKRGMHPRKSRQLWGCSTHAGPRSHPRKTPKSCAFSSSRAAPCDMPSQWVGPSPPSIPIHWATSNRR